MPAKHQDFWAHWWTQFLRTHPWRLTPQEEAKQDAPEQIEPVFSPLFRREHLVGKKVLELGCGVSPIAARYAHLTERFVGVDICELAILIMRAIAPEKTAFYQVTDHYDRKVARREAGLDTFWAGGFILVHLGLDQARPVMRMARDMLRHGGVFIGTFYKHIDPAEYKGQITPAGEGTPGDSSLVVYSDERIRELLDFARLELVEQTEFTHEHKLAVNVAAARTAKGACAGRRES